MLAKRLSNVKPKLVIAATLFVLATAVGYFLYHQPTITLLSPLFNQNHPPDLTERLSVKLSLAPDLDYSSITNPDDVPAYISYLLYKPSTGQVYATKNPQIRLSPGSFTKLMTTMVALDIAPPNQLFTATPTSIDKEPTILGLKSGEQLTLLELLRGAISTSANDAAATIAEGASSMYGQKQSYFITLMNQKALLMNMNNTQFANPEGYDEHNQYSTLEDLSKLVHNVQQNYPDIVKAGKADREDLMATSTHGFYYLPNWNGLLGIYPGITGLKIAYTENAGYSTILTSTRSDVTINLILLGAKSIRERDLVATMLLDHAFTINKIKSAKITEKDLQVRYDQWKELANKIRAELAVEEASKSSTKP